MTAYTHREPRTLFVVSRDFGELGLAINLLRDRAFAGGSRMVLPEHMFLINQNGLPVPASCYRTLDDIIRVIDEHKPEVVFLMSAYLFSGDELLSAESLQKLLGHLRDRRCKIVTSDPYIGLASRLTLGEVKMRWHPGANPMAYRALLRFMQLVKPGHRVSHVPGLEDVVHLYPTSVPDCDDGIRRIAVFNPSTIRSAGRTAMTRSGNDGEAANERPRWLFVISRIDLYVQRKVLGFRKFAGFVGRMLGDAVKADRLPTLVAPPELVDEVKNVARDSVEVLTACPHIEYERRLFEAEYVFYWNAFSNSQQSRLVNELPFFVFDRGHGSRIFEPYYEIARSCHYLGFEPTYLDQTKPLDAGVLHDLGERQKPNMRIMRERWLKSLTPDALVNQLCNSSAHQSA